MLTHECVYLLCFAHVQVAVYPGVKEITDRNINTYTNSSESDPANSHPYAMLNSHHLASYDILLTTYDVLRSEVHHDASVENSSRNSNNQSANANTSANGPSTPARGTAGSVAASLGSGGRVLRCVTLL